MIGWRLVISAVLCLILLGCQGSGVDPAVVQRLKKQVESVRTDLQALKQEAREEIRHLREEIDLLKEQLARGKERVDEARQEAGTTAEEPPQASAAGGPPPDLCKAVMTHITIVEDVARNEEKESVAETLIKDSAASLNSVLQQYKDRPEAASIQSKAAEMREKYLTFLKNRDLLANPYLRNSVTQQRERAAEAARELEDLCVD